MTLLPCSSPLQADPMRLLIVDDEPLARQRLELLLADEPTVTLLPSAAHGVEALALIAQYHPDLLLLDIRMPQLDGMALAQQLRTLPQPPQVIFTTAYSDQALAAFEVEAVDYLLKPIRRERLQQALAKAARRLPPTTQPILHYTHHGQPAQLPFEQIGYFIAAGKYVVALTLGGEIVLDESLKQLEQQFPDHLLRVHRNAVVATHAIDRLQLQSDGQYALTLKLNGQPFYPAPLISRRHLAAVKAWFKSS